MFATLTVSLVSVHVLVDGQLGRPFPEQPKKVKK